MNLDPSDPDLLLAGLGLLIGWIATSSVELRHRRLLHMTLIPVLLVGMRQLIPDGQDVAANLAGFTGFLVPTLMLAVLLVPSTGWFVSGALLNGFDTPDTRPLETLELPQVRRRIAGGLYEEAYRLLSQNLRRSKPTYEALYLKAGLELKMGMFARARRTVRRMGEFVIHDAQKDVVAATARSLERSQRLASENSRLGARLSRILRFGIGAVVRESKKTALATVAI